MQCKLFVRIQFSILVFILIGCATDRTAPPMVDGNCEDYERLGVVPIQIHDAVNLYFYQDEHYVWIGFDYPEGSYGTMDLKLKTPTLEKTVNLHVSAQIGEWLADQPETAPDTPESDQWWNNTGWIANPVWINGTDTTGGQRRYKFKNAGARELQLARERFGEGNWELQLQIRAIRQEDGTFTSVLSPADSSMFVYTVK